MAEPSVLLTVSHSICSSAVTKQENGGARISRILEIESRKARPPRRRGFGNNDFKRKNPLTQERREPTLVQFEKILMMIRDSIIPAICGFALVWGLSADAAVATGTGWESGVRDWSSPRDIPHSFDLRLVPAPSSLRINNVRLEAAPPDAPKPSAILRFGLLNDGSMRVTDVLIHIVIVETGDVDDQASSASVIVGPFTIRGNVTIEAGYTVHYEMLLRNLSSDCGCVARVRVLSSRPLSDPAS
jgi:hypothetical protein